MTSLNRIQTVILKSKTFHDFKLAKHFSCKREKNKEKKKWDRFSYSIYGRTYQEEHYSYLRNIALGMSGVCLGLGIHYYFQDDEKNVFAAEVPIVAGNRLEKLPTFKMEEVSKHSTRESGIWVIFKEGVYDITNFIDKHPGGDKIMMAAGGSVEPFWMMYGVHKQTHILALLEEYRIGNIDEEDSADIMKDVEDPYSTDPRRHPALKPCSVKPYNAEPPPNLLVDSFITPQEIFYVRNHLPVPEVDLESYELEITGVGIQSKSFKLPDLKALPKHTVTATIQCAGNRRSEMTQVKPVKGLNWGHAVIGNAQWTGVRMYDILKSLGLNENTKASHIQFEGLDNDPSGVPYGSSIPIEKALNKNSEVLLAYEMNGEPLSRDHGFPLRVIVPGVVGARNVKWLTRIIISEEESNSHWQQNDYKGFSPTVDWNTVDFTKSPAIQELPVISAICSPCHDETVSPNEDGTVSVKGYAWSGGGRKIVRVDVTSDQGETWTTAEFLEQDLAKHPVHWAWTIWTAKLPVPTGCKSVELWAKAVDSCYNTQPESFANIWNLRGVLSNAYHRIRINISTKS